jgi:hypothetical protein
MDKIENQIVGNASINQKKSILAKLLAQENITVEFASGKTAKFHLESRTLSLPIFKDGLSKQIYNLFIGHEVGHAIHSPYEGLIAAQKESVSHTILNIVEDARIEKLIKREYPGLKSDFFYGYKELFSEGFFGHNIQIEINNLNFLDRFNVFMKCGTFFDAINFSDKEKKLVEEGLNLKTWDDVVILSKKIQSYMKEHPKPEPEDTSENSENLGENGDSENFEITENVNDDPNDDITSMTQENIDKALQRYIDHEKKKVHNLYVPDVPMKLIETGVITYKDIFRNIPSKLYDNDVVGKTKFKEYKRKNEKVINYYIQIFNRLKNAKELKTIQFNKTGNLDLLRIHEYAYSSDIFTKNEITNKGQSHGLVLFLDWSISMNDDIQYSLEHLFTLIDFCRAIKIPYEVYLFTSGDNIFNVKKYKNIYIEPLKILNIFSSKMTNREHLNMFHLIFGLIQRNLMSINNISTNMKYIQELFQMGGTPLNETKILTSKLVNHFQTSNKVDIVNTVFITDGEGQRMNQYYNESEILSQIDPEFSNLYLHHIKTGLVKKIPLDNLYEEQTTFIYEILKSSFDGNVIGFYLDGKHIPEGFKILEKPGYDVFFQMQIKADGFTKLLVNKFIQLII